MKRFQSIVFKSLMTIALVLGIGWFKLYLNRALHIESPLLLFFGVIAVCAWFGGAIQGFFATILSTVFIINYFIWTDFTVGATAQLWYTRFFLYWLDCFLITILCTMLRNARMKISRSYTELKNTEASWRQSEKRLRKVFESNMIGIVFSDFEGNLLDANDYFIHLTGISKEDLQKQMTWQNCTSIRYQQVIMEAIQHLKHDQLTEPIEIEYNKTNGDLISTLVAITKNDERSVIVFILDISRRQIVERSLADSHSKLEERVALRTIQLTNTNMELSKLIAESSVVAENLRESRSFLDSVIENIPNMIFVKEAKDLCFVRFNKAGEDLLGYSRDQLVGKNDYDFFPKEQADFFTQNDRRVLDSHDVVDIPEEPLETMRGTRFLHTKKIPIFDKHGVPQYLLGISEDITERKAAEKQRIELLEANVAITEAAKSAAKLMFLSEASEVLNRTLDIQSMLNSFGAVVIKNMASWCIIDLFNEKAQTVERTVLSENHLVKIKTLSAEQHRSVAEISFYDQKNQSSQQVQGKISTNISKELLLRIFDDSSVVDEILHVGCGSFVAVPLIYYGKVFGSLILFSKNSQHVYGQLDLSICQDLAKRASFAIENAKLYSQANEANRAKSAFLANMSHEIRTPLGAMLGFAELALDSPSANTELKSHISTIFRNGQQLLRIVDEVLDISKVESDRIQIEKIETPLQKLFGEIESLMSIRANEKGLYLRFRRIESQYQQIKTDPLRLRQILLNIIGNAIKFTHSGGVQVRSYLNPLEDNSAKATLEVIVSDTGIGITREQAIRLFEPFMQADDSMTRKYGGTGLGLFLSRKLARLLGGDVVLKQSTLHQGSEFSITVEVELMSDAHPTSEIRSAQETQLEQPVSKEKDSSSMMQNTNDAHKNGKILVVEDSPDNQLLMKAFLGRMKLHVDIAYNGREGVAKAMQEKYDVVLMDIQMPEMDGFGAVAQLRELGYDRPVVAITAHAMKGDRERCLNSGFDSYLCKPITGEALYQCMVQYSLPQAPVTK